MMRKEDVGEIRVFVKEGKQPHITEEFEETEKGILIIEDHQLEILIPWHDIKEVHYYRK